MKITWSIVALGVLGVAAALCAALLTASLNAQPIMDAVNLPAQEVRVLVAKADIDPYSVVAEEALEERLVPKKEVPASYFSDPTQIIGKTLVKGMVKGQAFGKDHFPAEGSGFHLATTLDGGKRVVSVSLADYSGLEYLLYPGCHVDVLASFKVRNVGAADPEQAVSTTLIQNVEVLAVDKDSVVSNGDNSEDNQMRQSRNRKLLVALKVDAEQAKALQLAMEHGSISLAMRNPEDQILGDSGVTLLSGGQLANLAEFLAPNAQNAPEVEKAVEPAPEPPAPRKPPQVHVKIYRGTISETVSFQRDV